MSVDAIHKQLRQFLSCLKPGTLERPLLIAVSGGSDSLALLHAMADIQSDTSLKIQAATIDHSLRTEARAEAEFVHVISDRLNVPHHILTLDWKVGDKKTQASARLHRYRLLAQHAHDIGASIILTGHTFNDQMETCLLRARGGSGWWGLSGMRDIGMVPVWPEGEGLGLARPLLDTSRERLRDFLIERGISWIDDPSNENPEYERVRIRRYLINEPHVVQEVERMQFELSERRTSIGLHLREWLQSHATWLPGGAIQMETEACFDLPDAFLERLLMFLLPCVAGRQVTPRRERLHRLFDKFRQDDEKKMATLGGCLIDWSGPDFFIVPEINSQDLMPDEITSGVWGGRVSITSQSGESVRIAAWGERKKPEHIEADRIPPLYLRRFLPVQLDDHGEVQSVPHLEHSSLISVKDLSENRMLSWLHPESQFFRG